MTNIKALCAEMRDRIQQHLEHLVNWTKKQKFCLLLLVGSIWLFQTHT